MRIWESAEVTFSYDLHFIEHKIKLECVYLQNRSTSSSSWLPLRASVPFLGFYYLLHDEPCFTQLACPNDLSIHSPYALQSIRCFSSELLRRVIRAASVNVCDTIQAPFVKRYGQMSQAEHVEGARDIVVSFLPLVGCQRFLPNVII